MLLNQHIFLRRTVPEAVADETLSRGRLMAVTVCCDPGHRVKWLAVRRAHLGPVQGAAAAAIQLQPARQIIAC